MRTKRLAHLGGGRLRRRRRPAPISDADPRPRSWRQAWERDPWATQGGWIVVLAEAAHTARVFLQATEVAVRRFVKELRG